MTLLPCSLQRDVNDCCGARGRGRYVLAELLDLLDLAGELVGEGLLQRLQLALLAQSWNMHTDDANRGLAGVEAEAIEGGGPQRSGSAEGASQS